MVNELENSQIAMNSTGLLSKETILSNHAWVEDPVAEMENRTRKHRTQSTTPDIEEGLNGEQQRQSEDNQPE